MILVDANLLLYAYDASSERHAPARAWLQQALAGPQLVRFAWVTLLAFLRIITNPRAFEVPLTMPEATAIVSSWLAQPAVALLEPSERHWAILSELLVEAQAQGSLTTDAHLAALAIEHGAVLFSTDRDFRRFEGLRFIDPLAG